MNALAMLAACGRHQQPIPDHERASVLGYRGTETSDRGEYVPAPDTAMEGYRPIVAESCVDVDA